MTSKMEFYVLDNKSELSKRALDGVDSEPFSGISRSVASSFSCSQAESALRPLAGNTKPVARSCQLYQT